MIKFFYQKWILLAVIIAVNFLCAVKTHVLLYFFFFLCASIFAVLSVILVVWAFVSAQLSLTRRHMYKIEEGENLEVTILLHNRGIFPLVNVVIEDVVPCGEEAEKIKRISVEYVSGQATESRGYTFSCDKRGLYHFRNFTVYFFDPIGLLYLKTHPNQLCYLYNYQVLDYNQHP